MSNLDKDERRLLIKKTLDELLRLRQDHAQVLTLYKRLKPDYSKVNFYKEIVNGYTTDTYSDPYARGGYEVGVLSDFQHKMVLKGSLERLSKLLKNKKRFLKKINV